jgi:DNA-binding PadR family transcriptional regulator
MPAPPIDQLPLSGPVFHILLSLVDQDLHGYAIIKEVEARTSGGVRLTASTLYGAVARLLDGGLVAERAADAESPRRRTYRLTKAGRRLLEREAERLACAARWAAAKRLLPETKGSR